MTKIIKNLSISTELGITATGTTIADAFQLSRNFSVITAGTAGSGVKLPPSSQSIFGTPVNASLNYVVNNSPNIIKLYPPTALIALGNLPPGVPTELNPGMTVSCARITPTQFVAASLDKSVLNALSSINEAVFTSSGLWTCPEGVTSVTVYGRGGSGGGAGGSSGAGGTAANGGSGGGAGGTGGSVMLTPVVLSVVPGTTYTITIGAGGSAGLGGVNIAPGLGQIQGTSGGIGGNSYFDILMIFPGANGGTAAAFPNSTSSGAVGSGVYRLGAGGVGAGGTQPAAGGAPVRTTASGAFTIMPFFQQLTDGIGGAAGGVNGGGGGGASPTPLPGNGPTTPGANGGAAGAVGLNGTNGANGGVVVDGAGGVGGGGGGGGGRLAGLTKGGNGGNGSAGCDGKIIIKW